MHNTEFKGLTSQEVLESRKLNGSNILTGKKRNPFVHIILELLSEPMVVLLLVASIIYFISGQTGDAIFLAVAILVVAAISIFQNSRSNKALEKLKKYTEAPVKLIRDGFEAAVKAEEIVVGDIMIIEEGNIISADGIILQSNDFSVDESLLTGESMAIFKTSEDIDNKVYHGTRVNSGLAIIRVTHIGDQSQLGRIGRSLEAIEDQATPLQIQINNFVKKMVLGGLVVFVFVWILNYSNSGAFLDSLLKALTLAMSILPEEIPVAFATFMAMGTWRLMNQGIIVKHMQTIETLGSATVICADKTGTITENKMEIVEIYTPPDSAFGDSTANKKNLLTTAMWASEPIPFDPMEISIHAKYEQEVSLDQRPHFRMIHEYPLSGKPPMMTHLFENDDHDRIVAAKGAPEAILEVSQMDASALSIYHRELKILTNKGYRVLGVAKSNFSGDKFPSNQQDFEFTFMGFIAFFDPPKQNIMSVVQAFNAAGIKVKIITGDNNWTTASIAEQIDFPGREKSINGDALKDLDTIQFDVAVKDNNIFTRMYPEAKLSIINALIGQGEIVAMTGDGVNDGPALKAAHIGIAMGQRGTEIAKSAASLILVEDDLSKMVDAIAMGRKIYTNLKKAIRYIISIHIPIILLVFIPLVLGWIYPNIFTPVHVILLELIMGPTCSIIYENEPMEKNSMQQAPRAFSDHFFSRSELLHSTIQGLVIAVCCMLLYQYGVHKMYSENVIRTQVFTALMSANIFLTLVNRSFFYSIFHTLQFKNKLIPLVILVSAMSILLMIYVSPVTKFFQFESLGIMQLTLSIAVGFLSVIWYEFVKLYHRQNPNLSMAL